MLKSILFAICLTLLNFVSSFIFIRIALKKKENKKFMKIVFGSMVTRYFAILIIMWLMLKFLELDVLSFAITFMLSTFIFIFVEILYLNYRGKFLIL